MAEKHWFLGGSKRGAASWLGPAWKTGSAEMHLGESTCAHTPSRTTEGLQCQMSGARCAASTIASLNCGTYSIVTRVLPSGRNHRRSTILESCPCVHWDTHIGVPSCGWRLPPSDRHRMLRHFVRCRQSSCEMPRSWHRTRWLFLW